MSRRILGDVDGAGAFASTVISAVPIAGAGGRNEISPLCISLVALERARDVGLLGGPTTQKVNGTTIGKGGTRNGRCSPHIDLPHLDAVTAKDAKAWARPRAKAKAKEKFPTAQQNLNMDLQLWVLLYQNLHGSLPSMLSLLLPALQGLSQMPRSVAC
jgi:hypothetical protein